MLASISNAINGALNSEEIMTRLGNYGYTREIIETTLQQRLNDVNRLFAIQQKEYGEQFTANADTQKALKYVNKTYIDHLRIARIALKSLHGALHSIGATGGRKRSVSGFITEARTFYRNMLDQPRLLDLMAVYNITPEILKTGLDNINAAEKVYQNFLREKGEAQSATVVRDEAFDTLYDIYSDFRGIARIALADAPQLLEQMGITSKR